MKVIILSGGLDSTVLLYSLLKKDRQVHAVTFDYGQKHKKENSFAKEICLKENITLKSIDISSCMLGLSALTGKSEIPTTDYSVETQKITVVPNRNMIFLSIAAGYATRINASELYYAAHAGDASVYPDCRAEFVKALDTALYLGNLWSPIHLKAPFVFKSKAEIVKIGKDLNVPFEKTWSCYKGEEEACGICGTCRERLKAFSENNLIDPIKYKTRR